MTRIPLRVQPGVPTGGQFAAHPHADPELTLSADEIDFAKWRAVGLTAEEATRWTDQGLTPEDRQLWLDHGFTDKDAATWAGLVPSPKIAQNWKRSGFDHNDAFDWQASGFWPEAAENWRQSFPNPVVAGDWFEKGFDRDEATTWGAYGFDDPALAKEWKDEGFRLGEAILWRQAFDHPSDARTWQQIMPQPAQAREWAKLADDVNIGDVPSWIDNEFTVTEATAYCRIGIDTGSEAIRWKVNGFSPIGDLKSWADEGFSPEEAFEWKQRRFTAAEASAECEEGGSAVHFVNPGLTAEAYRPWFSAGMTPEQAGLWIAAGVDDPAEAKARSNRGIAVIRRSTFDEMYGADR